jgi:hypothetical protein
VRGPEFWFTYENARKIARTMRGKKSGFHVRMVGVKTILELGNAGKKKEKGGGRPGGPSLPFLSFLARLKLNFLKKVKATNAN